MAKIYYTNKAVEDLTSIWKYTASVWSVKQADSYYSQIVSSIKSLTENPLIAGKKYPRISRELCGLKSGKHIIFYRSIAGGDIKIIRILHGSMDLPNHLK